MSNKEKERTTFNFDNLEKKDSIEIDQYEIKAITLASGFGETPKTTANTLCRRTRRKTSRTEQFSTRLQPSTLEEIYQYADKHEITLAESVKNFV